ncbi:hypothetical protein KZ483_27535 [Paenibacillus sp. sptzw28]|uniref:hypothetical protein n=1 Tax=Paenibacillus sp. sptzw28 TaxID=715179 RepID=UPI001C6E1CC7|nr:hypothetical protein [Paenibacillus sp. sptzw28]QYR21378.1 hypothetical protein KZ483_27535 [Paenibacillus sp. sptzw28]
MLLSAIGEDISPAFIEAVTGFALGASLERNDILFFDNCLSSPEKGISIAFKTLGFDVIEKASKIDERIPLDELRQDLARSPVLLGPLDMGYLTYLPNHRFLGGCDHYVLALEMNETDILLHDPAGYPFVRLSLEQLEPAWRAERIAWSCGAYRYWTSPVRTSNPDADEIYQRAVRLFISAYKEQHVAAGEHNIVGKRAILSKADQIRNGTITDGEKGHLLHFAFSLGARRALDFSSFFQGRDDGLAELKEEQARLFGQCHTLAASDDWVGAADMLEQLAHIEQEIETAILAAGGS